MKYLRLFGYGAIIWAVAFIVVSLFIGFKISSPILTQGLTTILVILTAFFLAKSLKITLKKEILKYAISWVLVGIILDALITTRFTGWVFFASWQMWLSYAILFMVPFLAVKSVPKAV